MSHLLTALCLLVLFSCSTTPTDKELLEFGDSLADTREELEARLTKVSYESGGDVEFKAFPISETMIKVEVEEISRIRGFKDKEKELLFKLRSQKYAFEKNCFQVNINRIGMTNRERLKNWEVFIVDSLGRKVPTRISRGSDRAYRSIFSGIYGKNQISTMEAIMCSGVKVDLTKGFQLEINNQKSPLNTTLSWSI